MKPATEYKSLPVKASKTINGSCFKQKDLLNGTIFEIRVAGIRTETKNFTIVSAELFYLENRLLVKGSGAVRTAPAFQRIRYLYTAFFGSSPRAIADFTAM